MKNMVPVTNAAPVWQPQQTATQNFNDVDFTIENRTTAIVKVVLIEKWIAEEVAKENGTSYQDLYSLVLDGAHLIDPEQVDSPEADDLAHFFANLSHFILTENRSLVTLKGIKEEKVVKELFLRKQQELNGYVVTPYPPTTLPIETVVRLAKDVLTKNPEVKSRQISYNSYGAFLWGDGTYWASCIDQEMKPIPISTRFRNGTFDISNEALNLGIRYRITGRYHTTNSAIYDLFINHFSTLTIVLPEENKNK